MTGRPAPRSAFRILFGATICFALAALPAALLRAQPASTARPAAGAGFGAFGLEGCTTDLVRLNQLFGWQVRWPREWDRLRGASAAEVREAIEFWSHAPSALAADQAALAGSGRGAAAPRIIVERVLDQIGALERDLQAGAPPVPEALDPALQARWKALFRDRIVPAVRGYRAFLLRDYLPRSSDAVGLVRGPGTDCFRRSVRRFTTLEIAPREIEAAGLRLLAEKRRALGRLYGVEEEQIPALLQALRGMDFAQVGPTEIDAISRAAIARAEAAMGRAFGRESLAPITVEPLAAAMEATFPAGFYRGASEGMPAAYVINRSRPRDRRLMAEAIAFHETLPGHHVRAALALPAGSFNSGFAEGWAIYAEQLADELGLYSSRLDRAGMLAKHLWAASRLVIEPGLHVHGWSREQAVSFLTENSLLSPAEAELEVDRYISVPGQSLSYMLGYDVIASARRDAEQRLGACFDLPGFHAAVLGPGARPLTQVRHDVERWTEERLNEGACAAAPAFPASVPEGSQ